MGSNIDGDPTNAGKMRSIRRSLSIFGSILFGILVTGLLLSNQRAVHLLAFGERIERELSKVTGPEDNAAGEKEGAGLVDFWKERCAMSYRLDRIQEIYESPTVLQIGRAHV